MLHLYSREAAEGMKEAHSSSDESAALEQMQRVRTWSGDATQFQLTEYVSQQISNP